MSVNTISGVRKVGFIAAIIFSLSLQVYTGSLYAGESASESQSHVLVLDFELNDLTLNPAIEKETQRAAQLRPFLSEQLQMAHNLHIAELDENTRISAQKGKGYLFDRPAVSGELGRTANARWVISGRLHKASHLFVYLKAQLIDTQTLSVKADFVVEIKGASPKLTRKGVDALALQISEAVSGLTQNALKSQ